MMDTNTHQTTVLITRAMPHADALAAKIAAAGFAPVVHPLLVPCFLDAVLPCAIDSVAACLFTSRTAVRALSARAECAALLAKPCFAVGDGTAADLAALGATDVRVGHGGGEGLVTATAHCAGPILHITGEHRAEGTDALRAAIGGRCIDWTLYRMDIADGDVPHTDAVIFHSPRAAMAYIGRVPARQAQKTVALCLGKTCIELCSQHGFAHVHLCCGTDDDAMVALLEHVFSGDA